MNDATENKDLRENQITKLSSFTGLHSPLLVYDFSDFFFFYVLKYS